MGSLRADPRFQDLLRRANITPVHASLFSTDRAAR